MPNARKFGFPCLQESVRLSLHIPGDTQIPVATLSLFRFPGLVDRVWVIGQMVLARPRLRRESGLLFVKLCGSGTGEGFTPRPNWQVWALLAVWKDEAAARRGVAESPVWRAWRARAAEDWTLFLEPLSARGSWSAANPFLPDSPPPRASSGPVAALTRATVRPRHALRFWRRVPDISSAIGMNQDVAFKIGIGEMPFLHQVTFSVWPDTQTMAAFARADGPHARAIRAVRDGDWFAEELYARFRLLGTAGRWQGGDPLAACMTERDAAA